MSRYSLPDMFAEVTAKRMVRVRDRLTRPLTFDEQVSFVLAMSAFVAEWAEQHADQFADAVQSNRWSTPPSPAQLRDEIQAAFAGAKDEPSLKTQLRTFRNEQQVGLVWRELLGINDLSATLAQASLLAEVVLKETLDHLYRQETQVRGTPMDETGAPQSLVILAMGKLGAGELNLSSDIDLIFAYPSPGETQGAPRSITNQAFFLRLAQTLIRVLDERTADGFVFRVDMRLRPFGESGPLVSHFDALESYYQEQGRDWERYALIKARAITGDPAEGQMLLDRIRPFVYRRYLDFGAIDAMRDMKALIDRERASPRFLEDVKLGPGGIREVEFIAQVFQLIFGGRHKVLQQRSLQIVLQELSKGGWLSSETTQRLLQAYQFLRRTEHALQALRDEQTQLLPATEDDRWRIALIMGFSDAETFRRQLDWHRTFVQAEFAKVIADDASPNAAKRIWPDPNEEALAHLQVYRFTNCSAALLGLQALAKLRHRIADQSVALKRLDQFVPRMLQASSESNQPDLALQGMLKIAESVLRRSAYLALLNENQGALVQLARLCALSPWLAERLSARPALLDELLDVHALVHLPDRNEIGQALQARLVAAPDTGLEATMFALRAFKEASEFRVAVCDLAEYLPLMKVSDALTWLAEAILEAALDLSKRLTAEQFGTPADGGALVIIGYGKLGGIELGPTSDLDLLFLHDTDTVGETNGVKPVANGQFFARLVQRLMHVLTTPTINGVLYEIDTRLRPSGRAGTMVTSLAAFASYQRSDAWTYEHQALVRARPVAGDARLAARFVDLRLQLLCQPRDRQTLKQEVITMRQRMLMHQADLDAADLPLTANLLKQGRGGIIDIEFMVQFLALAHAHESAEIVRYTDNVRILEAAAAQQFLDATDAQALKDAYLSLRGAAHRLALQGDVEPLRSELKHHRQQVRRLWSQIMEAK